MKDSDNFEALLKQFEQEGAGSAKHQPKVGDRVRGEVVSISPEQVFIDLGGKSEGVMESEGLTDADGNLTISIGDTLEATVTSVDEETGTLLLGSQHGRHLHGIAELEHAFQHQIPVEGQVTGVTKGGVEVQIAGQRAFCPASQLDLKYIEDMGTFVGQRHAFRITKFEGGRHTNLVVSRRALLEEEQRALAAETRARLEVGAVLPGTVTSLKDYGAFVDLGGVEGMVHISELAFGHVKHPSELLGVGQQVEVAVLRIEATDNPKHPEKIALSIRALAKDPWQDADQRFAVGTRVKGTVTRLQTFGAFVELEPGLEGLVHISELGAGRRISHPQEIVSAGDQVEATVLSVDREKRRIGLSLDTAKVAEATAEAKAYTDYQKPKEGFGTLGDLLRESMNKKK
ncbi:MAG: 30S ribosomal protein S1 [Pseudomonadota bacterium]|nr:30S ribosomal protein S1 [Pseudomonadota bacterium]